MQTFSFQNEPFHLKRVEFHFSSEGFCVSLSPESLLKDKAFGGGGEGSTVGDSLTNKCIRRLCESVFMYLVHGKDQKQYFSNRLRTGLMFFSF